MYRIISDGWAFACFLFAEEGTMTSKAIMNGFVDMFPAHVCFGGYILGLEIVRKSVYAF